jgi:flagellar L-ring protein precursor FlgH
MLMSSPFFWRRALLLGTALVVLSGCNAFSRLSEVGGEPKMEEVQDPSKIASAQPVRMPMPNPTLGQRQPNALWQTGSRAFFRDQRASRVGDILTVVISLDEKAQLSNETKRERTNTESAGVPNLFGFESSLNKFFPDAIDASSILSTNSALSNDGKGSVDRSEKINLKVAATITQVLPNGNLVLAGRQQMVVNYDLRELRVTGVIRPEDISTENTITYDKIAEARIAYGGRGTITDIQQPRYGSQVLDVLMPF